MNEKIQHTPGPWTAAGPGIRETAGRDPRIMVLHPDGQRLIATTHEGSCLVEKKAKRRTIKKMKINCEICLTQIYSVLRCA
jgi:hypothetical protein